MKLGENGRVDGCKMDEKWLSRVREKWMEKQWKSRVEMDAKWYMKIGGDVTRKSPPICFRKEPVMPNDPNNNFQKNFLGVTPP